MEAKNLIFKSDEVNFEDFVKKLLDVRNSSAFFPDCFHEAIIGINTNTKSVVYSLDKLVELEINLRFEEGGLNPEYDEVDDDILTVCQDSILKFFQMIHFYKEGVPPTLYVEYSGMFLDHNMLTKNGNTFDCVFGEEVCRDTDLEMPSKEFTYDQLIEFVSTNDAEYLRFIELRQFSPESTFQLIPRELLDFEDNDEPIIRTVVQLANDHFWLGFQDLTFDQWELGTAISKEQNAA